VLGKNTIAIVKQVFVFIFEPDGLAQLLERPGGSWMGGDVAVNQAPAAVLDHHEHIQQAERGGDGNKEVTGNDSLGVKTQERRPAQVASWSAWRTSQQVPAHGPRR
jgi:hypothetical protein